MREGLPALCGTRPRSSGSPHTNGAAELLDEVQARQKNLFNFAGRPFRAVSKSTGRPCVHGALARPAFRLAEVISTRVLIEERAEPAPVSTDILARGPCPRCFQHWTSMPKAAPRTRPSHLRRRCLDREEQTPLKWLAIRDLAPRKPVAAQIPLVSDWNRGTSNPRQAISPVVRPPSASSRSEPSLRPRIPQKFASPEPRPNHFPGGTGYQSQTSLPSCFQSPR